MTDIVLDGGNAFFKWFYPKKNSYGDFRHAISTLTDNEWRQVVGRGKPPAGYVRVNGAAYAIGAAANRHIIKERPKGAARYHALYYGVGMAYALSEALMKSNSNVTLIASHAPQDIDYVRNLVQAARARWEVECQHGTLYFDVNHVSCADEPLMGYSHFVLTEKGDERTKNPLASATTLVVDVGGYTVDVVAVDPGGEIDLLSAKSTRTGVINLTDNFTAELRSNNQTLFQDVGDLDIRRVENAILEGVYRFGKVQVPCQTESQAAINQLVNEVIQVINAAGGAANFDYILMTGGGAALIYDALITAFPRAEFLMAERKRELMKYANVFGGAKIAALLRKIGAL